MIALTLTQLAHAVGGELLLAPGDTADTRRLGCGRHRLATDRAGRDLRRQARRGDGRTPVRRRRGRPRRSRRHRRAARSATSITQIVVPDVVAALADLAREVVRTRPRARRPSHRRASPDRTARPRPRTCSPASSRARARQCHPRRRSTTRSARRLTMLRVTGGTRYLVSEFGASAPGEIARLAGLVEPDIGVVLMVGMAHAGGFGGIEATLAAKSELVRAVRRGGIAVLNADDARVAPWPPIAAEGVSACAGSGAGRPGAAPRCARTTSW